MWSVKSDHPEQEVDCINIIVIATVLANTLNTVDNDNNGKDDKNVAGIAHIIDKTNYHNNDFYLADLFTFAKLITQSDLLWKEFIHWWIQNMQLILSEAGGRRLKGQQIFS